MKYLYQFIVVILTAQNYGHAKPFGTDLAEGLAQERQGILEIPKQIAAIIRHTIEDSLDRVFTTPTPKDSAKTPPPKGPAVPRTTRDPSEFILSQYLDGFIASSTIPPTPVPVPTTIAPAPTRPPPAKEDYSKVGIDKFHSQQALLFNPILPVVPVPAAQPLAPNKPGALNPEDIEEYIYLIGSTNAPAKVVPVPPPKEEITNLEEIDKFNAQQVSIFNPPVVEPVPVPVVPAAQVEVQPVVANKPSGLSPDEIEEYVLLLGGKNFNTTKRPRPIIASTTDLEFEPAESSTVGVSTEETVDAEQETTTVAEEDPEVTEATTEAEVEEATSTAESESTTIEDEVETGNAEGSDADESK